MELTPQMVRSDLRKAISIAFQGGQAEATFMVWAELERFLDVSTMSMMKSLWICHKRWERGPHYKYNNWAEKAYQDYTIHINRLSSLARKTNIFSSIVPLSPPVIVNWSADTQIFRGELLLQLPVGMVGFYAQSSLYAQKRFSDKEDFLELSKNFPDRKTVLLNYFFSLVPERADTSFWDLLLD